MQGAVGELRCVLLAMHNILQTPHIEVIIASKRDVGILALLLDAAFAMRRKASGRVTIAQGWIMHLSCDKLML